MNLFTIQGHSGVQESLLKHYKLTTNKKGGNCTCFPPKSSEAEDLGGWEWELFLYMAFTNAEFQVLHLRDQNMTFFLHTKGAFAISIAHPCWIPLADRIAS